MRDEVLDFKSAVAEICDATLKPQPNCFYGYAKDATETAYLMQKHQTELIKRSFKLTSEEINQSVKWVEMFYKPTEELARTICRIKQLTGQRLDNG